MNSDMAKDRKEKQEQKTEKVQSRIYFTAVSVDLEEDVDPSSPFQGFKLVPGLHIPKDYKENLAKQEDAKYQEFLHNWIKEKDPEKRKGNGRKRKENGVNWSGRNTLSGWKRKLPKELLQSTSCTAIIRARNSGRR